MSHQAEKYVFTCLIVMQKSPSHITYRACPSFSRSSKFGSKLLSAGTARLLTFDLLHVVAPKLLVLIA